MIHQDENQLKRGLFDLVRSDGGRRERRVIKVRIVN